MCKGSSSKVVALSRVLVLVLRKDFVVLLASFGVPEELHGDDQYPRSSRGEVGGTHLTEDDEVEEDGSSGANEPGGIDEDVLGGEGLEQDGLLGWGGSEMERGWMDFQGAHGDVGRVSLVKWCSKTL